MEAQHIVDGVWAGGGNIDPATFGQLRICSPLLGRCAWHAIPSTAQRIARLSAPASQMLRLGATIGRRDPSFDDLGSSASGSQMTAARSSEDEMIACRLAERYGRTRRIDVAACQQTINDVLRFHPTLPVRPWRPAPLSRCLAGVTWRQMFPPGYTACINA